MDDDFAAGAIARRLVRDNGSDALRMALDVADLPCLQQNVGAVRLWRDVAQAVTCLQEQTNPSGKGTAILYGGRTMVAARPAACDNQDQGRGTAEYRTRWPYNRPE